MKIKNPKSISQYQVHDIGSFSYRQFIFICLGVIIIIVISCLLCFGMKMNLFPAMMISLVPGLPTIILGTWSVSGLNLPTILKRHLKNKLYHTEIRKYGSPDGRFKNG